MTAFSYSGDPATSARDEVRFLTQDTDETCPLLSDNDLEYLLGKWLPLYNSVIYVASIAAATIARKWAKVVNVSDSGTSAATGDLQARYTLMAQQLMDEYQAEGDVGGLVNLENILSGTSWDYSIEPLEFAIALGDNPRAGDQSWGGVMPQADPRYDVANEGVIL
jgi:hypothetical protein